MDGGAERVPLRVLARPGLGHVPAPGSHPPHRSPSPATRSPSPAHRTHPMCLCYFSFHDADFRHSHSALRATAPLMCGIAGVVALGDHPPDPAWGPLLRDALAHRGPD